MRASRKIIFRHSPFGRRENGYTGAKTDLLLAGKNLLLANQDLLLANQILLLANQDLLLANQDLLLANLDLLFSKFRNLFLAKTKFHSICGQLVRIN
jgi:hypothetical protein